MSSVPASRRWLARGAALLVVLSLLAPAGLSAATYDGAFDEFAVGTIEEPAGGTTVASVQGFHFRGRGATKKPARLAAFGPRGEVRWVHNGSSLGARWFYDVDPLPNGNLLVVATNPDGTLVYEFDPRSRERVWIERLDIHDTHDVDLLENGNLLVANMRNYDASTGENDDRIFVYDRESDEVVWEWRFRNHGYAPSGGGTYAGENDDWTHVNDVDEIDDGEYLVSVRNFDQAIVVNRSTKAIEMRLGSDGNHAVMFEQHNPQYLESEAGRPTILVADSENGRIVEYERRGGEWVETWELTGSFSWPRDADRLPNGNTLIVDSLNHRVVEVTPGGEIVWEVYAPWGTYDAERVPHGDEAAAADDLPTIRDLNATGTHELRGSAGLEPGAAGQSFAQRLAAAFAGTPVAAEVRWFATRWEHVAPWIYPVWMSGWDFAGVVAAGLLAVGWGGAELLLGRRRIVAGIRRRVP